MFSVTAAPGRIPWARLPAPMEAMLSFSLMDL